MPDAPTQHWMLPGTHEWPRTPECRCGAGWDRLNDQCVAEPGVRLFRLVDADGEIVSPVGRDIDYFATREDAVEAEVELWTYGPLEIEETTVWPRWTR